MSMNEGNIIRSKFGVCPNCKCELEPSYAQEIDKKNHRWKIIVDYLFCPECGETSCVDDSFDGS